MESLLLGAISQPGQVTIAPQSVIELGRNSDLGSLQDGQNFVYNSQTGSLSPKNQTLQFRNQGSMQMGFVLDGTSDAANSPKATNNKMIDNMFNGVQTNLQSVFNSGFKE